MNQLTDIESDFFDLEDEFTHSQICIETHWLFSDSRLDNDSLNKDYPISVIL